MTLRQHWPKPDLLQQRRLELGLPPDPVAVEPLPRLLLKGAVLGVVLLLAPLALLLFLEQQQRRLEAEVVELAPVEVRKGPILGDLPLLGSLSAALNRRDPRMNW